MNIDTYDCCWHHKFKNTVFSSAKNLPGKSVLWLNSFLNMAMWNQNTDFAWRCLVLKGLRLKCTIVIVRCPSSLTFHIFDFSETAELNSMKLDGKQDLNVVYQVCVFQADRDPWPSLSLAETFSTFTSETTEWNPKKLDRKQDLNVPYQVCVFHADQETKLADPSKRWHIVLECMLCGPLERSRKCLIQSEAMAAILFFQSAQNTQTW